MFCVRLITADSYQAKPLPQLDPTFSEFRGSEIKYVPVIRIFGTTSDGEKTCLHVHGVFPYLFLPYTGEEDPGILAYRLATSLDAAINVSLGSASSNTQHVYSIQRVSGTPFYGYHRKEHQFLKIYFYNPAMIKRAADLLQNGSVLNQSLQPHEAHINYILQFMMDYNIYGMSSVNLRFVKHRRVPQTLAELTSSGQSVTSENSDVVYLPLEIERQSTCQLEIDALASDILNRLDVEKNLELNPGLAAIWNEERARRAQAGFQGGDSQLVNPKSPPRPPFDPTDNDLYQEQRLARRLLMISQCDESTLSTTSNRSIAYAAEVRDGENLLNSSRIPDIPVQRGDRIEPVVKDDSIGNTSFVDTLMMSASQNTASDGSILGTEDMPLVDLLFELAQENEENPEHVDTDSLLGSQPSVLLNNDEKSDDEDIADLNLTSLQLDTWDSLERIVEGVDEKEGKDSTREKNISKIINDIPYLSPYEISSCSSKSAKDDNARNEEKDTSECHDIPQYDGAGDVSPSLMNSDDEDLEVDNAKDYSQLPDDNGTSDITSESQKCEKFHQNIIISRKNSVLENTTSDVPQEKERSNDDGEFLGNNETRCNEVLPEIVPSSITSDTYLEQYNDIDYEPFDRLLEICNDFVPDFTDMPSSMEIGILAMSSRNSEKSESVGEIIDQEIPLETVLNGDPCFTESAELDKSDLTELRDQYVSLLDNALLPDIRDKSSRIDDELADSSTLNRVNFPTMEKNNGISSNVETPRVSSPSRDDSSSLENSLSKTIQPEAQLFTKTKSKDSTGNQDSQNSNAEDKDLDSTNGTSDYNCNVVATWAELQNLEIVDKTETSDDSSRWKIKRDKYTPAPRSIKERRIRLNSTDESTSQLSCNDTERVSLRISDDRPGSPKESSRNKVLDETENKSAVDESLPNVSKLSANEDETKQVGSTIDSDNLPVMLPENAIKIEKDVSQRFSFYSSQLSNLPIDSDKRRHKHFRVSKFHKLINDRIFNEEYLWLIREQRRGRISSNIHFVSSVCTKKECRLPVVFLKKINHGDNVSNFNIINIKEEPINEVLSPETRCEKIDNVGNSTSRITSIVSQEKIVDSSPDRICPRNSRQTRGKPEVSSLPCKKEISTEADNNASGFHVEAIESGNSMSKNLLVDDVPCKNGYLESEGIRRGPYNTRRRILNFVKKRRRNTKVSNENAKKDKKEIGKSRLGKRCKEENLPGIPGILNPEPRQKNNRLKKIILTTKTGNTRENAKENLSRLRKNLPAQLFPNWESNEEAEKNSTPKFEALPKKRRGRKLKADSSVSFIPKIKKSSPNDKEDFSSECTTNHSSTPKKIGSKKIVEPESEKKGLTNEEKLPETVALNLLLKEAKSRSTRMALKLLLRKRTNDKYKCEQKETMKKNRSKKAEKRKEKKIVTPPTTMEESVTINDERCEDATRRKNEEEKEGKKETFTDSNIAAFEIPTDSSQKLEKTCDSISMESLENVSDICNPNEFDSDTVLSADFCSSVTDTTTDIFDNETTENSLIPEETTIEEYSNVNKEPIYETDRYENAIKEANFFAGKDYSIDAVSNEIPTCLFEEDSNSVDKRLPKKITDHFENSTDFCHQRDVDDSSELSFDLRGMDVYDVRSLTPCSSLSQPNDLTDDTDLGNESLENDDFNHADDTDQVISRNVTHDEDLVQGNDSILEEKSPSFESLSPKPGVTSGVGKSVENEFNVFSKIESAGFLSKFNDNAITRIIDSMMSSKMNSLKLIDNSKVTGDGNLSIRIDELDSISTRNNIHSSFPDTSKSMSANETENDKENNNAKLDKEIGDLVSQVVTEFNVENDAETVAIIDAKTELSSKQKKLSATPLEKIEAVKIGKKDETLLVSVETVRVVEEFVTTPEENGEIRKQKSASPLENIEAVKIGNKEETVFVPVKTIRFDEKEFLATSEKNLEIRKQIGKKKETVLVPVETVLVVEEFSATSEKNREIRKQKSATSLEKMKPVQIGIREEKELVPVETIRFVEEEYLTTSEKNREIRKQKSATSLVNMESVEIGKDKETVLVPAEKIRVVDEYLTTSEKNRKIRKQKSATSLENMESVEIGKKKETVLVPVEKIRVVDESLTTSEKNREIRKQKSATSLVNMESVEIDKDKETVLVPAEKIRVVDESLTTSAKTHETRKQKLATPLERMKPIKIGKKKEKILASINDKPELRSADKNENDFPTRTEKESEIFVPVEKKEKRWTKKIVKKRKKISTTIKTKADHSSSFRSDEKSSMIIENDGTLPEANKKEKQLSSSSGTTTKNSTSARKNTSVDTSIEDKSPTPTENRKLIENNKNQPNLQIDESQSLKNEFPSNIRQETILTSVETETKLSPNKTTNVEESSKLPETAKKAKELPLFIAPEVTKSSVLVKKDKSEQPEVFDKKKPESRLAADDEKCDKSTEPSTEDISTETEVDKLREKMIIADGKKNSAIVDKPIERSSMDSKTLNKKTEKNRASESQIISRSNEVSESTKNSLIYSNKNEVDDFVVESESSESTNFKPENTSEITKSLFGNGNRNLRSLKNRVECQPVSIKLVNIDLSKISSFLPKNLQKSLLQEEESSPEVEETFRGNDAGTIKRNSQDPTPIGNSIEETNSHAENIAEVTTTEISSNKDQRKRRKKFKDTKLPERRSVRICAEMTLKLSQEESLSKLSLTDSSSDKNQMRLSTQLPEVRESSLTSRTREKIFKECESSSTEILKNRSRSKSPRVVKTVESSLGKHLQNITEKSTTTNSRISKKESIEKGNETIIPQEFILSEQIIVNENSGQSSIKGQRKGRTRKNLQPKSQEIVSSTKITDENTEPISNKPKRKNSQEKYLEARSSKSMTEVIASKVVEKTPTVVDSQAMEIDLKIVENNTEAQTCGVSSKRIRPANDRFCKIGKNAKIQREVNQSSSDLKTGSEQNLTENLHRDLNPSTIFSILRIDTNQKETNNRSKDFFVAEKNKSLPKEEGRSTAGNETSGNIATDEIINDDKIVPKTFTIQKRRGRSEKQPETIARTGTGEKTSSSQESINDDAKALTERESSPRDTNEMDTEAKNPVVQKRRGRSRKLAETNIAENNCQTDQRVPEKKVGKSNNADTLKNENPSGRQPEVKLDSQTLQPISMPDTIPEIIPDINDSLEISVISAKNNSSEKKRRNRHRGLSLGKTSKIRVMKKRFRKRKSILQKILDGTVETRTSMVPKKNSTIDSVTEFPKMAIEDVPSGEETKSPKLPVILPKISNDNAGENSSVVADEGPSKETEEEEEKEEESIKEKSSSPIKIRKKSQECESSIEKTVAEKSQMRSHRIPRRKSRYSNKSTKNRKSYLRSGSSSNENNFTPTKKQSKERESLLPEIAEEARNLNSKIGNVLPRRGRSKNLTEKDSSETSGTKESTDENSGNNKKPVTDLTQQSDFSEPEKAVVDPPPNKLLTTNSPLRKLTIPQKRVHFDEESIRKCSEYLQEYDSSSLNELIFEPTPKKHYKLSLNRSPEALKVESSMTPSTESSNDTPKPPNTSSSVSESFCASERLKTLRNRKKDATEIINNDKRSSKTSSSHGSKMNHQQLKTDPVIRILKESQSSKNEERFSIERMIARNKRNPIVLLKRLRQNCLDRPRVPRDKKFVEISKKSKFNNARIKNNKKDNDDEFEIPAYDGPADLSSSDNDEDPDATIVRYEKRICTYSSAKKTSLNQRDSNVTPKKRKFDIVDNSDGSVSCKKRQALVTTGHDKETPKKTSYPSPSGTSMLKKSPGRMSGNYSPLKIIVTSPKVRKDIHKPSLSCTKDKQDEDFIASPSSSASTSLATSVLKKSRLRDTVLRGRFRTAESSLRGLGDERTMEANVERNGVGELDEIKGIDWTEDEMMKSVCVASTSDYKHSSRIYESTTLLRDGKDVRKKLVFPEKEEEINDSSIGNDDKVSGFLITESCDEILKLQLTEPTIAEEMDNSNEALDLLDKQETIMFDVVPGPSSNDNNKDTENYDNDDDDVCDVTFTQYIESQINKKDESPNHQEINDQSNKRILIIPKFKPPTRQRIIETMENYGIPKYRNQEPFFSDPSDVPKQKELAQKMLGVPGKDIQYLPAFVSSVEGVTSLTRWRKMWLNEFHPSLAKLKEDDVKLALVGNERVTVTPLALPPTQRDVKNWLRARRYLEKKKNKRNEEAKKEIEEPSIIHLPDLDKNEMCSSNTSDCSVIEPSPERTFVTNDTENRCSALKKKLMKKGLFRRVEIPGTLKNEREIKTIENSPDSNESKPKSNDTDSTMIDPSLVHVLNKSQLFRNQETSRHLAISRGQIEFLSDSTRSNVANENLQNAKALTRYQYLTIMCLEVHVNTRGDLLPDAQHDAITAIFYSVQSDVPPTSNIHPLEHGVIVLAEEEKYKNKMYYTYSSKIPWTISFANNEEALLNSLINLITRTDPEILIGWELEAMSWGYVFQRALHLGINLSKRVSRIPGSQCKWEFQAQDIETLAEVKLPGRIVLDIWRLMRHEAALLSYTFESVMHHVLNERIPCPSFKTLTNWWNVKNLRPSRWRVIEHYSIRVLGIFRILDQLDIIGRTSELARLFGIQFFEVFSRGSQFRVESVMLRLAKPLNYIAVSPSAQQRACMRAMEALPLIMEPESMLYHDPLIVLDFQSLYPSIIIAHNYCFSTCLGRIEHIGQPQPFEFGAYTLRVPKKTALKLQGKVNYAPCGVAFVKPDVRLGILPRMLTEILETRFMVKKAMKDHDKDDKTLQRALHSRQMGLKFLANVTYGYTAANFSGRMPCIEVGDSVISKSKETLERAIKLVESTPKWGARVVYGDTDSLFILVPGKSKAEAFVIGNEIADAVTASNPQPIKLKFEKVLYPAILQTKKRYCGYMYETPEQEKPTYLAKGIETVRRDGCPAVSKILEKTLKILFETKDVSLVKKYVTRQLDKVLRGKVSIQDLTFAKEFRGLKGYKAKACVPALELTRRLIRKDPRAVPRTSERVRYIIVAGAPNQALIHCVRTPWELINDPGLRPNALYYVTRVIIPPLNRCLNLMGVDVNAWYRDMPHRQILDNPVGQPNDKQKLTIFQYFGTIVCVACGQPSNKGICTECLETSADTLVALYEKVRWLDRTHNQVTAICQSCVGQTDIADCASLDCPVLYRRAQAQRELTQVNHLREIIKCGNNLEF